MVKISLADIQDVEKLLRIVVSSYRQAEFGLIRADFPRVTFDEMTLLIQKNKIYKANLLDEPVAVFKLDILDSHAEFGMMAVDDDHQKKGVANEILESVYEIVKAAGRTVLKLEVLTPRDKFMSFSQHFLIEWYQKKGFVIEKTVAYEAIAPSRKESQLVPCSFVCLTKSLEGV